MRRLVLALVLLAAPAASARSASVVIHSARPFGYFVGDLIHARVEIAASADATLTAASLPRAGPLTGSLDLRRVAVREGGKGGGKVWQLDLTYQTFYVALDVRNIDIPGFAVSVTTSTDTEIVRVPSWRVGVSPLREVVPERKERAEDYLRPDAPDALANEARPRGLALAFGAAGVLVMAAIARDRAWPPFQGRPARPFSALARRLASKAREGADGEGLQQAFRDVHRALDLANGASLLAEDLAAFLERRSEFAVLRPAFQRFFAASNRRFFGRAGDGDDAYDMQTLANFAAALGRRERAA